MTQEKPWWIDNEYWWPYDPELGHQAKHVDMIAEATRRGEKKAWEEARVVIADVMDCSDDTVGYYEDALQKKIDAKLASLANDKV